MSDKLNQGMIKNFNWHWDHQQGAVFLKKDEIYAHRKNLAEFFYRAGHASRDAEVAKLKVENVELKWSYKMLEDKREDLLLSLRERNSEILQLKEKLWAAEGRIKGMTEGLEILKGERGIRNDNRK